MNTKTITNALLVNIIANNPEYPWLEIQTKNTTAFDTQLIPLLAQTKNITIYFNTDDYLLEFQPYETDIEYPIETFLFEIEDHRFYTFFD